MPRTEARIFTSIWRDPAFTCLPADAQWLYQFLLGQDDLSYCGVLPLRPSRWCKKAADMTVSRVEDALKWLEGRAYPTPYPPQESAPAPLVISDAETGELFVRSLMRRDGIWKMPNIFKLAIEAAGQVESPRILGAMLAEARRFPLEETGSEQVRTLVADFVSNLEKGSPYPTAYPSADPPDYPPDEGSDDPTAKDYARARGIGGSVVDPGISPDPLFPGPQRSFAPQAAKRGSRLPEDFPLTDSMRAWAAEHAPHVSLGREHDQFCDYWHSETGARAAKKDWPRAWQVWMRRAEDQQAPRQRLAQGVSAADQRRAQVAQLRELDRQQREGQPSRVIQGRAE